MYIDLVLCKHANSNKPFLFQAPFCSGLRKGDSVIVETVLGAQDAMVIAVDHIEVGDEFYDFVLLCAGATHPLRRVIKRVVFEELIYEGADNE